mgnify:FL=1
MNTNCSAKRPALDDAVSEMVLSLKHISVYDIQMFFRAFSLLTILTLGLTATKAYEPFVLGAEPLIRIGLSTNSSSVSITTGDSSLVAYSPDEQVRMLAANRVSVAARSYRPPEVEN